MINKEMNELLDDIMLERISNMSDNELREDLSKYTDDIESEKLQFKSIVKDHSQFRKKQILIIARQKMVEKRQMQYDFDIRQFLAKIGKDAKEMLIELLAQEKLPENLTLAFRDGKDFTDDDAEKVLEDLVNMGAVDLDDKKN